MNGVLLEASVSALSEQAWRLIDEAELVVADLDGCLASDNIPLPGVAEFVARTRERLVVASNNSTHSAADLAQLLARNGLQVAAGRIVLAGEVAVQAVAARWPGARLMLLGTEALRATAHRAGLRLVDDRPEVVLLTRAIPRGTSQLEAAVAALHDGCPLVVANPDLSHPGENGVPRVETGAVLALLRAVLPQLHALVIGKPEQPLFQAALDMVGVKPERAVMIGDNPVTDIAGALRMGMRAIHLGARSAAQSERAAAGEAR